MTLNEYKQIIPFLVSFHNFVQHSFFIIDTFISKRKIAKKTFDFENTGAKIKSKISPIKMFELTLKIDSYWAQFSKHYDYINF